MITHSPTYHMKYNWKNRCTQYTINISDVTMGAMVSQITSLSNVYLTIYSDRSKKTPKFRVTGLCVGKSPVTGEFPAQMASNAENVSTSIKHIRLKYRYHSHWISYKTNMPSTPMMASSNGNIFRVRALCGGGGGGGGFTGNRWVPLT